MILRTDLPLSAPTPWRARSKAPAGPALPGLSLSHSRTGLFARALLYLLVQRRAGALVRAGVIESRDEAARWREHRAPLHARVSHRRLRCGAVAGALLGPLLAVQVGMSKHPDHGLRGCLHRRPRLIRGALIGGDFLVGNQRHAGGAACWQQRCANSCPAMGERRRAGPSRRSPCTFSCRSAGGEAAGLFPRASYGRASRDLPPSFFVSCRVVHGPAARGGYPWPWVLEALVARLLPEPGQPASRLRGLPRPA